MFNDRMQEKQNYASAIYHADKMEDIPVVEYKKPLKIALLVVGILVLLFLVLKAFSLPLALTLNGFSPNIQHTFTSTGSADSTDKEVTVVHTTTNVNEHALVHLEENELGFWTIVQSSVLTDEVPYCDLTWFTTGNEQSIRNTESEEVSINEPLTVNWEKHAVLIGNDAVKKISMAKSKVPEGYYFRIYQQDSFYIVEAVTQSEEFSSSLIYDAFRHCLRP